MLTDQQRADLAATGLARLPGVVPRATAATMADAVWGVLAARGVVRDDPATWPIGMPSKLQAVRKQGVFDAFASPLVDALVDEIIGTDRRVPMASWAPLVTFPQPGPWVLPHQTWHLDLPGRAGGPDGIGVARLLGFATDVGPQGGGTLVVEGSHEVVRRMVAAAPGHDIGGSAAVRKRLQAHPWFRALSREGGDRVRQFMVDGDEVDGVRVRVAELTGEAGDVTVMLPWTLHNIAMNVSSSPRFMFTHTVFRSDALGYLVAPGAAR